MTQASRRTKRLPPSANQSRRDLIQTNSTIVPLLKIFSAVVEENGIANAQIRLNKDASTISRALTKLESHLGLTLCQRGRAGFSLTSEGKTVYEEVEKLQRALSGFDRRIAAIHDFGSGSLRVGILDNILQNPVFPLGRVFREYTSSFVTPPAIDVQVMPPRELEKALAEARVDICIGILPSHSPGHVRMTACYENDLFYCGRDSALHNLLHPSIAPETVIDELGNQALVTRDFLEIPDMPGFSINTFQEVSYTANLEAVCLMIASGAYVGFLPEHYAEPYVKAGEIHPVLPERLSKQISIQLVTLKSCFDSRTDVRRFFALAREFMDEC
ncbi:LysR family transcriptional regulator [uncultured Ruegeria sp.]|uniref:LysR family transcriptional regulator n=1 Tax=uncultured Ruegeria sp. TaxID=259304 RepID=UPI002625E18D|nr:LysR family transcriptional regulator [uncultured Ruegeria sp.]